MRQAERDRIETRLLEIDESLRRLYRDSERFGVCESCGAEIGVGRPDMVPWAKLCIDGKRREEEGGES